MIRGKQNIQAYIYYLVLWCILCSDVTTLYAGRRDWVKRQRAQKIKVAQQTSVQPDMPLSTFLGIPQDIYEPESSLKGLLGISQEEEPPMPTSAKQSDEDLYNIITIDEDVPEEDIQTLSEQQTDSDHEPETKIVDEALETINTAAPIEEISATPDTVMASNLQYEDEIELYFENADLQNFVQQIEDVFDIKFISDDALDPLPQGAKSLKGNKISYRTHKPISRQKAWNTFNTFLNIAGFAVVPQPDPRVYRIVTIPKAQKSPLLSFIGIPPETLPDTDELIRYVYFIENNTIDTIKAVVEQFRSSASSAVYLNEHRAFMLTDIAYNIKKLMEIIKELDKVIMPESLSILKLRRADARQVKELYDTLVQQEQPNKFGPRTAPRKQPSVRSLPENVTIVAEPRTNSLILLGPKNAREHIEEFIIKNIDVELDQAYSPLHTYPLRYANAQTIAEIMNSVTKFGADTEAGRSGGIRGGDQYMRPMSFTAEPKTNQLIIRGHYEDYLKAEKIIRLLDEDQPQVAIEVLILSLQGIDTKELGAQIRSKIDNLSTNQGGWDGLLGNNVKFQTSGLFAGGAPKGIQQNTDPNTTGVQRLLGNLINLVTGAPAGNTIITLGQDIFGVWGIMQMLETITNVQLVSNPFLIATNKTPAEVSLGETRRVATAQVVGSSTDNTITAQGNESANLVVQITPQITSDGMIVMDLDITIDNFISPVLTSPDKNTKKIKTSTILANKQVLALGGLVRHIVNNDTSKVPILGDIPILGWFFKNRRKRQEKQNLLILVSARIVEPTNPKELNLYNNKHIAEYETTLGQLQTIADNKDPIHRLFFAAQADTTEKQIDDFLFNRKKGRGGRKTRIARMKNRKKEKEAAPEMVAETMQVAQKPVVPVRQTETPINTVPPTMASKALPLPVTASGPVGKELIKPKETIVACKPQVVEPSSVKRTTIKAKHRENLSISDMLHNSAGKVAAT